MFKIFKHFKALFIHLMTFFKIISHIFGPSTLHGSIVYKTLLFSTREKVLRAAYKCDVIFRSCTPVKEVLVAFQGQKQGFQGRFDAVLVFENLSKNLAPKKHIVEL